MSRILNGNGWLLLVWACMSCAFVHTTQVHAQDYPVKPIRMVIPFVPGGANDVIGRIVGLKITGALGQQVVVENRGGMGGSLGVEIAAKRPRTAEQVPRASRVDATR